MALITEIFANNATAKLGSTLPIGQTTITLVSGTGSVFPNPNTASGQWFSVTLVAAGNDNGTPNEICYCTARNGDTLTVLRGQEGTTQLAWNIGDSCSNLPTAYFYNTAANVGNTIPAVPDLTGTIQRQPGNYSTDSSSNANAITVNLSPSPSSMQSLIGMPIRVLKNALTNTGPMTVNVNGLGNTPLLIHGAQLQASQFPGSTEAEIIYDGAANNGNFHLIAPSGLTYNNELAPMPPGTFKANPGTNSAQPQDIQLSSLQSLFQSGITAILMASSKCPNGTWPSNLPNGPSSNGTQNPLGTGLNGQGLGYKGAITIPISYELSSFLYSYLGAATDEGQNPQTPANLIINFGFGFDAQIIALAKPYTLGVLYCGASPYTAGNLADPPVCSPAILPGTQNNLGAIFMQTNASNNGNDSNYQCFWLSIGI